jgi:hypothetical protein
LGKKNESATVGLAILGTGVVLLFNMISETPLLGVGILLAIISLCYMLFSGGIRDRRTKTGYKHNRIPTSFGIRLRNTFIGLLVAGVFFVVHYSFFEVVGKDRINRKAVVFAEHGLHLRSDTVVSRNNLLLTIPHGDTIMVFDEQTSDEKWIRIVYDGKEGWVSKNYVNQINK